MASRKPSITRTFGPVHFEDLEPHRFEDLVRELVYDFRDWQAIEATGRSGADEGFDIRAYEKARLPPGRGEDDEEGVSEPPHPMEGNLWMIQGKREQQIGPKRLREILVEIDGANPPYGYILAASANFSKESYDTFREELRSKGVMEFYLWGKAELEDMLHLPKNDRILFTFFGISLVSRRRSRATEARTAITVKNKLFRVLGENPEFYETVLVRDLADTHYPFKNEHPDFEQKPRWKEYLAHSYHPLGVWLQVNRWFAYLDREKNEWDFTKAASLTRRDVHDLEAQRKNNDEQECVRGVFDFFPKANQATFCVDGIIEYTDIAIVDEKGDVAHKCPHLYVDFKGENGPFAGFHHFFDIAGELIPCTDEYLRISVFPDSFPTPKVGTIHGDKAITLDPATLRELQEYGRVRALYDADGRYGFLQARDVVPIAGLKEEALIQVTHVAKTTIARYLERERNGFALPQAIRQQIGRGFKEDEEITVHEFKRVYRHQFSDGT